ncbi:YkvA family protein [Mesorhizobium sp. ANAO-SY3R2]|uniref:YkvA family protein n=1 Tax=Mesorhizobium sp. ANAO-SY3R2 TaxID=3166644 RepID=UPI00366F5E78
MSMLEAAKRWARRLKRDVVALYLAARSPLTPWYARLAAACVAAYALSPVDLIPDFVPVLGYLDDLLIVPPGIWLVIRMIPAELMAAFRAEAAEMAVRPRSKMGLAFIVAGWLAALTLVGWWATRKLGQ